jgi:hypothetical protein
VRSNSPSSLVPKSYSKIGGELPTRFPIGFQVRSSWRIRWLLRFALLQCLTALLCSSLRAQQNQTSEFPEIDTYVGITDRYRLMFLAARSTDGITVDSAQLGANLDINFRPLLREALRTNDSAKENFLTFRIGYQFLNNVGKPDENRVQLALTSRFHLPWLLELSERNRFDLRVIGDQFSWRYRNCVTIERSFLIKSFFLLALRTRRDLLR